MTNLITQPTNALEFMFEGNEVRVVRDEKGEPWFVAKDVAETLGYVRARDAISQHCKGAVKMLIQTSGGNQMLYCISKVDLLKLVLNSKLPNTSSLKEKVISTFENYEMLITALNEFEVPEEVVDMYVYAVRNKETGRIKLGISRDPLARIKTLQVGNDCELELVAYKKADNKFKDEKILHDLNKAARIRGEWFEAGVTM